MVAPALNLGEDRSRAKELIEATATDNVSFQTVLHNLLHLDRDTRPNVASTGVRCAHLLLSAALTLLTLAAGTAALPRHGPGTGVVVVGALTLIMLMSSPVCHSHYFALSVPLVMGLLVVVWERDALTPLNWLLLVLFSLQVVGNALPLMPGYEQARDIGANMGTALALWLTGCLVLVRRPCASSLPVASAGSLWRFAGRGKAPERLPVAEKRTKVG